jgi:HNH endonuclease
MFHFRGALADLDGAFVEGVLNDVTARMRPAKGQRWDRPAHRGAGALVEICAAYEKGAALPAEMVEAVRAEAKLEPVAVDSLGAPVVSGRVWSALSEKIKRAVLLRDGHCRCGTCDARDGLHVHHLVPVSWGGTDAISNLAAVCTRGNERIIRCSSPKATGSSKATPTGPTDSASSTTPKPPSCDRHRMATRPPSGAARSVTRAVPQTRSFNFRAPEPGAQPLDTLDEHARLAGALHDTHTPVVDDLIRGHGDGLLQFFGRNQRVHRRRHQTVDLQPQPVNRKFSRAPRPALGVTSASSA